MNKISRRNFLGQMRNTALVSILWSIRGVNTKSLRAETNGQLGYGEGAYNFDLYPAEHHPTAPRTTESQPANSNIQIFLPYVAKE